MTSVNMHTHQKYRRDVHSNRTLSQHRNYIIIVLMLIIIMIIIIIMTIMIVVSISNLIDHQQT